MLQRYLAGLIGSIEAVGRTRSRQHGHGALAVTSEEHLQQVGLFRLGGQTRSRTAALHVEHHQGQLHDDSQVHGLALQADARTAGRGHAQGTGKRCSQGRGGTADLVLALHGGHAQRLVLRQLVQHVRSRSDGIRAQIELQPSLLGSSNESVGRSLVARDVHIAAGHLVTRLDAAHVDSTRVRVVTIVIASLHHLDVVLGNLGLLGKLLLQVVGHQRQVAVEEPAHQTQRKHIAALQHRLVVHARVGQRVLHHLRQRALDDAVGVDAHLAQIVGSLELSLLQILRSERVGVDDDRSIRLGIAILRLQRSSIHSHQHVALVARRVHLPGTDVHLETAHTRQRALRGADVGRIVGEC